MFYPCLNIKYPYLGDRIDRDSAPYSPHITGMSNYREFYDEKPSCYIALDDCDQILLRIVPFYMMDFLGFFVFVSISRTMWEYFLDFQARLFLFVLNLSSSILLRGILSGIADYSSKAVSID